MDCIDLEEALKQMDKQYESDIAKYGMETPYTFDAEKAKKILKKMPRFVDVIRPVRCKNCTYKKELFTADGKAKGNGFKLFDCEIMPGGYLGEEGYCSQGRWRSEA